MAAVTAPPRSLKDVEDLHAGAVFPGPALEGCRNALVLFAALWHGKQDAYWIAQRGIAGTCVDLDGERLAEMRDIYPGWWTFVEADVYLWAQLLLDDGVRWDAVTLDPYVGQFDRAAERVNDWCGLAERVVVMGMDARELRLPEGWRETGTIHRSDYHGGVYWRVLTRG